MTEDEYRTTKNLALVRSALNIVIGCEFYNPVRILKICRQLHKLEKELNREISEILEPLTNVHENK